MLEKYVDNFTQISEISEINVLVKITYPETRYWILNKTIVLLEVFRK